MVKIKMMEYGAGQSHSDRTFDTASFYTLSVRGHSLLIVFIFLPPPLYYYFFFLILSSIDIGLYFLKY
jgi:hypothetical protein